MIKQCTYLIKISEIDFINVIFAPLAMHIFLFKRQLINMNISSMKIAFLDIFLKVTEFRIAFI